jgi:hypothetical protein
MDKMFPLKDFIRYYGKPYGGNVFFVWDHYQKITGTISSVGLLMLVMLHNFRNFFSSFW